ncbi:nitroreductase/quinone reductase family protein [Occultella kanbiaonis]|uniref:nitroreductase/quinone reductase family protein n=1 Tax=Occultella kanbiaonis TaxID=2675754 RepID=UPI0013D79C25|nr:nitroreductase/quinone reductase family protein [Occultella kanbiaonis]
MRTTNRVAVALHRGSGGSIGGTIKGLPVLLLTAPGRRTGVSRTVPIVYFEHDGGYLVVNSVGGSPVAPAWFANARAASRVRVEIGRESFDAEVTVPDAAGNDHLWQDVVLPRAPFFATYQSKAHGRTLRVALLTPLHE